MRTYIRVRKHARRQRLIEMLGGCCVRCGTKENLEFDHVDPSTKRFSVCAGLTRAWDELVEEARKCQLLCRPCHIAKGAKDRPEPAHGLYRYWYWACRCDVCRAANAAKSARQRAAKLSRAKSGRADTLAAVRSGVAQSAEQPAVNRLAGSSSLPPRAQNQGFLGTEDQRGSSQPLSCGFADDSWKPAAG